MIEGFLFGLDCGSFSTNTYWKPACSTKVQNCCYDVQESSSVPDTLYCPTHKKIWSDLHIQFTERQEHTTHLRRWWLRAVLYPTYTWFAKCERSYLSLSPPDLVFRTNSAVHSSHGNIVWFFKNSDLIYASSRGEIFQEAWSCCFRAGIRGVHCVLEDTVWSLMCMKSCKAG